MTTTTKETVQVSKFIRGKRDRVFSAWLQPELAKRWFCPEALRMVSFQNDPRVGGTYLHKMEGDTGLLTTAGTYKEITPSEKLVFTWGPETPERADSVVTIEFTDQDGGTLVTLTHEKLPEGMGESHREGWTSALEHLSREIGNI